VALADVLHGQTVPIVLDLVDEVEIEAIGNHRENVLQDELGESFAETDTLATVERQPAECIAFFAGGGL